MKHLGTFVAAAVVVAPVCLVEWYLRTSTNLAPGSGGDTDRAGSQQGRCWRQSSWLCLHTEIINTVVVVFMALSAH